MEKTEKVVDFEQLQKLMEKEPELAVFAPKEMVDKAEKQIEKKLSGIMGKATALNTQIDELKAMVKVVKNEDVSSYFSAVKKKCDRELENRLWSLETQYKNKAESIDAEIRKKRQELEMLEPTAKYYSAIVYSVLQAVQQSGYDNLLVGSQISEIVCKALDVASYQKWQEIKGENWGRNTNEKEKYKII